MENTFKRALKDVHSRDAAGLYTNGENFVVVVRTPDELFPEHGQALGMASFLGGGVGGYLAGSAPTKSFDVGEKWLSDKQKEKQNKDQILAEVKGLIETMKHITGAAGAAPADDVSPLLLALQKLDTWHHKNEFERVFDKVFPNASELTGQYPWLTKPN